MIARYSLPEMSAIWSDESRAATMVEVELTAADACAALGIIPRSAARTLRKKARWSLRRIAEIEHITQHDVIALVSNLAETSGPAGRYLHFGMTSSDVLDTALAVQLKRSLALLLAKIDRLLVAFREQAIRHRRTVMMGRTHGVHAEPITFGLKMALFYDEFRRNRERLALTIPEVAVGKLSGAVGIYAHLDPRVEQAVCKRLGLSAAPTSSQIVPRDRYAVYLCHLAIVAASLERLATELRHLARTEVGEAAEPFAAGQKGSSAMPHKRNPILCERICGLSRLLRGYAVVGLENVALWHERDISHSSAERVILPDASLALDYMLEKSAGLVERLVVDARRMRENLDASRGLWASESVLLALVEEGLSREKAYAIVQRHALRAADERLPFRELLAADGEVAQRLSPGRLAQCFDLFRAIRGVDVVFKRLGLSGGRQK